MQLDLAKLNFTFTTPPLLIGGKAMEYYGLRPAGADIDFVVTQEDYLALRAQYPERLKELWGDLGVCPFEFEIWRTICLFDYAFLARDAVELDGCRVISLDRLLLLKALGYKVEKYRKDLELIVDKIPRSQAPAWDRIPRSSASRVKFFLNLQFPLPRPVRQYADTSRPGQRAVLVLEFPILLYNYPIGLTQHGAGPDQKRALHPQPLG